MRIVLEIQMPQTARRKRLNITVREDIIEEAKALGLNISETAEAALVAALKKAKEEAWLRDSADAIEAYNKRIEKEGVAIQPIWARK